MDRDEGRNGGKKWQKEIEERNGGKKWRKEMEERDGGKRWRKEMEERDGGKKWRKVSYEYYEHLSQANVATLNFVACQSVAEGGEYP